MGPVYFPRRRKLTMQHRYGDQRQLIRELCGDNIASKVQKPLGINREGEINTLWRYSGVPGLYLMFGMEISFLSMQSLSNIFKEILR